MTRAAEPGRIAAAALFGRTARELQHCADKLREVEGCLLPLLCPDEGPSGPGAPTPEVQNIDLLVQSLEDLAGLMNALAVAPGAEARLDTGEALSRMRLFDLRGRMAGEGTETAASARAHLF